MKILKILFVFFALPLVAMDARPPCFKQLERDFFQFKTVGEALGLWNVPQGQWNYIIKTLQSRAVEADAIIVKKARQLNPNPLERPFQPDVARDLIRDTMAQIFERVLLESGFYDTVSIGRMFDYIWLHDLRVHQCFPEK